MDPNLDIHVQRDSAYIFAALQVPPESQATSEALAEEMLKSGRVTLAGLNFDKEKADMPPDAEKILGGNGGPSSSPARVENPCRSTQRRGTGQAVWTRSFAEARLRRC